MRHHVAHLLVEPSLKSKIAISQDSDQPPIGDNRQPRDPEAFHHCQRLANLLLGTNGDRIDDHSGFIFLDGLDLRRLLFDRKITMDKAEATQSARSQSRCAIQ